MQRLRTLKLFFGLWVLVWTTLPSFAQYDIPKKPNFIPPVIDKTNILSKKEFDNLYNKLVRYNDSTSTEIIIVIIPSTKGENIGLLAPRWGQAWEIGKKNKDNGVFILLAKQERKIWISPGYGIEDRLTAGMVGTIIRTVIIPEFKKGDFYSGLNLGTDAIIDLLAGRYKNKKTEQDHKTLPKILVFILFLIVFIFLSKRKGGGRGRRRKSTSVLDAIILSNMGRSSGSSLGSWGGSSGGGFGGFGGGGGFSGGGAGGSW